MMTAFGGFERPPKESGSHKIVGRDSWRPPFKTSNITSKYPLMSKNQRSESGGWDLPVLVRVAVYV